MNYKFFDEDFIKSLKRFDDESIDIICTVLSPFDKQEQMLTDISRWHIYMDKG